MSLDLSDEQVARLAVALEQLEPGFLPRPIFDQIARLITLPVVEFVPLRRGSEGVVEVLLLKRPDDDPFWPGLLHTPGTIVRATDLRPEADNEQAFNRIAHDELKDTKISRPHFVGSMLHKSKRGTEQAGLYWVKVTSDPQIGEFYLVDNLPPGLIDSQVVFIRAAARDFVEN